MMQDIHEYPWFTFSFWAFVLGSADMTKFLEILVRNLEQNFVEFKHITKIHEN